MNRDVTLEEISDGKLYRLNDMVKANCYECKGCSECCHGMGDSITLTPYDIYLLTTHLELTFEELMKEKIELNVQDGIILPNLKLDGPGEGCRFLDEQGRCSIHDFRPGICRLFPLARYYEEDDLYYILLTHECKYRNRGKIKVIKWLDTPDIAKNEAFIIQWHRLVKNLSTYFKDLKDEQMVSRLNTQLLKVFYLTPYNKEEDFYEQIEKRFALVNA